ncbi:aminopeptidase P N-terminal domain-containing protein [Candidatus Dependentiae bacterium]|nr:aminopeptidase P N-terminal domain-containing protein [Candidatus Dependentiae bacterium]
MYKKRRALLLDMLHEMYPEVERGVVVFFAGFEDSRYIFRQESSFYYFTGINEPGAVTCLYWDGREELFLPKYSRAREQWATTASLGGHSFDMKSLGKPCQSYYMKPFFYEDEYENVIKDLKDYLGKQGLLLTLLDQSNDSYFFPIHRFENLFSCMSLIAEQVADISPMVASLRRKKDDHELELLSQAIEVTKKAHLAVAQTIKPDMYEYELQAEIERVFTKQHAQIAFPSIVAAGKNSTVLHYMDRDKKLQKGDLVVVDIGAQVGLYCADMTRTYPVSGLFTDRQQKVYDIVLELQTYIASRAKPGSFLQNSAVPERSLHHMAEQFLEERGLKQYFVHGIGHFLGLDVHDVGDLGIPLGVGDVITIEPGLYFPKENIGVRIEDVFVITHEGCKKL